MKYLLLFLLAGCSYKPKFNVGDCIAFYFEAGEFTPARTTEVHFIITKVGNISYLYYMESFNEMEEENIKRFDKLNTIKVKCDNLSINGQKILESLSKDKK